MRSYARRLRRLEEAAGVMAADGGCHCPPEILLDFKRIEKPDGDVFCVRCRATRQLICIGFLPETIYDYDEDDE